MNTPATFTSPVEILAYDAPRRAVLLNFPGHGFQMWATSESVTALTPAAPSTKGRNALIIQEASRRALELVQASHLSDDTQEDPDALKRAVREFLRHFIETVITYYPRETQ